MHKERQIKMVLAKQRGCGSNRLASSVQLRKDSEQAPKIALHILKWMKAMWRVVLETPFI